KRVAAGGEYRLGQAVERFLGVLIIHADPRLHRDGHCDLRLHRGHAIAHQLRFLHQAGAERPRLHTVRRAADIQVDLAIAEIRADPRRLRKLRRLAAAELKGDGTFGRIEAEQPPAVAVDDGVGNDHLRVKQRFPCELPVQEPAMPVRPVHHRRNGKDFVCSHSLIRRSLRDHIGGLEFEFHPFVSSVRAKTATAAAELSTSGTRTLRKHCTQSAGLARRRPFRLIPPAFPRCLSELPECTSMAMPEKAFPVSWDQFHRDARALAWRLASANGRWKAIVCITRGGLVPAAVIARELGIRLIETVCVASYHDYTEQGELKILKEISPALLEDEGRDILIVDDLTDTGKTAAIVRAMVPKAHFATV